MSAIALISGKLHRGPETKTSAKGSSYVTATLRVGAGEDVSWWRLMVFSKTIGADLMSLAAGDSLSATGPMRGELYTPRTGGEPRLSLSLVVDRLITLKKSKRERPAETRTPRRYDPGKSVHAPPGFSDEVPF